MQISAAGAAGRNGQNIRLFIRQTGDGDQESRKSGWMREGNLMEFRRNADSLELIRIGLERYQAENFGKCLLNCGDIISICEALGRDRDVLLKNRGNYAEIIETRGQGVQGEKVSFFGTPSVPGREDYPLKDWQREIMERDQARSGYLYGKAI